MVEVESVSNCVYFGSNKNSVVDDGTITRNDWLLDCDVYALRESEENVFESGFL